VRASFFFKKKKRLSWCSGQLQSTSPGRDRGPGLTAEGSDPLTGGQELLPRPQLLPEENAAKRGGTRSSKGRGRCSCRGRKIFFLGRPVGGGHVSKRARWTDARRQDAPAVASVTFQRLHRYRPVNLSHSSSWHPIVTCFAPNRHPASVSGQLCPSGWQAASLPLA
jgi:hypothetical protein